MPPGLLSRYSLCTASLDDADALVLSEPEPFRFVDLSDNRQYVVQDGDSYFSIAGRFFKPLARASGFWWVIIDFQPVPIIDPTVPPAPGTVLVIPSVRTVTELIVNEARRTVTDG